MSSRATEGFPDWVENQDIVCDADGLGTLMSHQAYIASGMWRIMRHAVISIRGKFCGRCEAQTHGLEVHHKVYPCRWGEEKLSDLVVLCIGCHRALHARIPDHNDTAARQEWLRGVGADDAKKKVAELIAKAGEGEV